MMPIILTIILLIIIIVAVFFLIQKKSPAPQALSHKQSMVITPTSAGPATPVITPVTAANVDQTLNNTDTSMQQAVNQVNTDLNSISSINPSQDSTSGL